MTNAANTASAASISTPLSLTLPTGPQGQFNFADYLFQANATRGEKAAFIDDHGCLTYAQLETNSRQLAQALSDLGIQHEQRVLLLMQDCSDWPVAFLGCLYAGIIPVAVNTLLTADDYAFMLADSRSQAVLVSGALLPTLKSALAKSDHCVKSILVSRPTQGLETAEFDFNALLTGSRPAAKVANTGPDDMAFWLYSSGSTGRPKGTVHSHANPFWTTEYYAKQVLNMTEDDVCFSAAKLFFAYGLGNGLTFPLSVGASVILMAERPTPEACFKRWLGEVGGMKPTIFYGAPTGFAGMLASTNLPDRSELALRMASSAGEALPADLGERFTKQFGIEIIDGIGSTEMLHIFLSNLPGKVEYGTTGYAVPGYEIELRADDGGPVPDGEPGDLYIKGPSAAMMYWGNREKTRATFQGEWTKSGDKYIRNKNGSYTYSGRSDDMLKVSGIYVSPFEVEATLVQHPAVLEAAVIGIEDEQGLTKPKAFIVLKSGQSTNEAELKAFIKERLAPYKYPRFMQFVSELPKTATGKIQRFKLRDLEKKT